MRILLKHITCFISHSLDLVYSSNTGLKLQAQLIFSNGYVDNAITVQEPRNVEEASRLPTPTEKSAPNFPKGKGGYHLLPLTSNVFHLHVHNSGGVR